MRRVRVRSAYRNQSFGGWGGLLGGKIGGSLGNRLGQIFGKKFGRKMADKYLPGLFLTLGGALFPGLAPIFGKNKK